MIQATAGALQRPTTPYSATLRPPAPTLEVRTEVGMMLPPPSDMVGQAQEEPKVLPQHTLRLLAHQVHTTTPATLRAIIMAYTVDNSQDQPYKPEPDTTYAEAIRHLRREDYILVHGGRIVKHLDTYTLRLLEEKEVDFIPWEEVQEIVAANYPGAPCPTIEDTADTLPCPAPKPEPHPGVGLYAFLEYGVDLDYIHPDSWKPITFPQGVNHQCLYVGDLMIDDQVADVWWSLPLVCYLAQFISQEELLERHPHLRGEQ